MTKSVTLLNVASLNYYSLKYYSYSLLIVDVRIKMSHDTHTAHNTRTFDVKYKGQVRPRKAMKVQRCSRCITLLFL
jgi:hypothetical protein